MQRARWWGSTSRAVGWLGAGAVSLAALSGAGCGDADADGSGSGGSGASGSGGASAGPTFHRDVEPILQNHCLVCHTDGRIGEFSLESYDDVAPMAGFVASMTEARLMPPWHAIETDECQPRFSWKDDLRLSDEQIATLRAWADGGAPKGDPADAPPPFELPPDGLPAAELDLAPAAPSIVEGDRDLFTCVLYEPALTGTRFIEGIHFVADNDLVAHHALVFRVDRTDAEALSGGGERFPCFGAPPGDLVHAWAPGGIPMELPDGVGMELTADQVLVVQMHYHPTGSSTEEDRSSLQLRFTETDPIWQFLVSLPGNAGSVGSGLLPGPNDADGVPEFRIPANAEDHVEEMVIQVPSDVPIPLPILSVATHMHYVGVDMRFWVERPNPGGQPAEECLVQTPRWDFNWQRFYQYDVPISELPTVTGGDRLRLRCRYDNTMKNPFLAKALADAGLSAPEDVRLGEETLDEMCLGAVGFLVPNGAL